MVKSYVFCTILVFFLTTKNDMNKNILGSPILFLKKKIFQNIHKCTRKYINSKLKIIKHLPYQLWTVLSFEIRTIENEKIIPKMTRYVCSRT